MKFRILKQHKNFSGYTVFAEHDSEVTQTTMKFSYFQPKGAKVEKAIIWLSGLTCNEENFISKAGAQPHLAQKNVMIICPDTSPRGLDLPGEHKDYSFGSGAGFYVNALTPGYADHYNMYDYVLKDIVSILKNSFGITSLSISGHSMGGHGALVLGLREADIFSRVSAFSPVVNPTACPWGQQAFLGYLGDNKKLWENYDATMLMNNGHKRADTILIDQGTQDDFLAEQLLTENFSNACKENNQNLQLHYREGYDHSYYFISTFIKEHIDFLCS